MRDGPACLDMQNLYEGRSGAVLSRNRTNHQPQRHEGERNLPYRVHDGDRFLTRAFAAYLDVSQHQ